MSERFAPYDVVRYVPVAEPPAAPPAAEPPRRSWWWRRRAAVDGRPTPVEVAAGGRPTEGEAPPGRPSVGAIVGRILSALVHAALVAVRP